MDKQYGPRDADPKEWDDVEQKMDVIGNMTVGDVLAWATAGVILVAGIWQSFQPVHRLPPERGSAV